MTIRTLWFILAAVFSVAALAGNWFSLPAWVPIVSIVIAGVFLVVGFAEEVKRRSQQPVVLDDEQEQTIRRLKQEGNTPLAISQIQMWFRDVSAEDAARIVREV